LSRIPILSIKSKAISTLTSTCNLVCLNKKILMGDYGVTSELVDLLEGVISPPITLVTEEDDRDEEIDTIQIPDDFLVRVGGGAKIYNLFNDMNAFHSLSTVMKKGIFDTLYLILRRGTYDVVRFRCHESGTIGEKGIIDLLLTLLSKYYKVKELLSLSKRIIRLLGIMCTPCMLPSELKRFLKILRKPSIVSNSMLHSLKVMIRQDDSIVKSAPVSFFNFGGVGSGLYIRQNPDFFKHEFQFCFWFRVESFRSISNDKSNDVDADMEQQFLSCSNEGENKLGFKVYIMDKHMYIDILEGQTPIESLEVENLQLRKGVWYHLNITHSKARYALFYRSKICIRVDGVMHFDQFIGLSDAKAPAKTPDKILMKTPESKMKMLSDAHLVIGKNFDGQIGVVYYFLDPLPADAIDVVSRLNARKRVDGYHSNSSIDLLPIIFTVDGKSVTVVPSIGAVYHPSRIVDGYALDIHGGRHATLGSLTHPWNIKSARDILATLGGVSCLLPLFPRLLIENDQARNEVTKTESTGLGSSPAEIYVDHDCLQYLGESALEILAFDKIEVSDEGCIGLLLSIISRCIQSHDVYLHDFAFHHGISMIEVALGNVSDTILRVEGDTCAVALIELKQVVGGYTMLENSAIKHLLSNFKVWSKASVFFQKSLISILHAAVSEQPQYFIRTVGVHWFLDQIMFFVPSVDKPLSTESSIATPPEIFIPEGLRASTSIRKATGSSGRRFGSIYVTTHEAEGKDSVRPTLSNNTITVTLF
jgi:hypothetical protein